MNMNKHKEFIADKVMDEDYYILTLMAVARELNVYGIREADVYLAAGLPLTWIRKQRGKRHDLGHVVSCICSFSGNNSNISMKEVDVPSVLATVFIRVRQLGFYIL